MLVTLPKAEQRDNRYDPLGDSIRKAVEQISTSAFYAFGPTGGRVRATVVAEFTVFGSEGDREEPTITLDVEQV